MLPARSRPTPRFMPSRVTLLPVSSGRRSPRLALARIDSCSMGRAGVILLLPKDWRWRRSLVRSRYVVTGWRQRDGQACKDVPASGAGCALRCAGVCGRRSARWRSDAARARSSLPALKPARLPLLSRPVTAPGRAFASGFAQVARAAPRLHAIKPPAPPGSWLPRVSGAGVQATMNEPRRFGEPRLIPDCTGGSRSPARAVRHLVGET